VQDSAAPTGSGVALNKHTLQCFSFSHTVSQIKVMTRRKLEVMSERHNTAAGALWRAQLTCEMQQPINPNKCCLVHLNTAGRSSQGSIERAKPTALCKAAWQALPDSWRMH